MWREEVNLSQNGKRLLCSVNSDIFHLAKSSLFQILCIPSALMRMLFYELFRIWTVISPTFLFFFWYFYIPWNRDFYHERYPPDPSSSNHYDVDGYIKLSVTVTNLLVVLCAHAAPPTRLTLSFASIISHTAVAPPTTTFSPMQLPSAASRGRQQRRREQKWLAPTA